MVIPKVIGNLPVILSSVIDDSCIYTENCIHTVNGVEMGKAKWVAIAQAVGSEICYLYMCYGNDLLSDTAHENIGDAVEQAEWEYSGILLK